MWPAKGFQKVKLDSARAVQLAAVEGKVANHL